MLLRIALPLLVLAIVTGPVHAQPVLCVRSGLILFTQGDIALDGRPVAVAGRFTMVPEGGVLKTDSGRADVLLTPAVFLRLDENSAIRMLSSSLLDTRVELLEGSMIVSAGELLYDNTVTLVYRERVLRLGSRGFYRLDGRREQSEAQLRVHSGQVAVIGKGGSVDLIGPNQEYAFASGLVETEAPAPPDALALWDLERTGLDCPQPAAPDPKRRRIARARSWFHSGSSDGTF